MMFLVLFGSLAAAMAVASKGNIRTAATHLHVMRALGAAETGLELGAKRLAEAAGRFVVANSNVDATFGQELWSGNLSAGEDYNVLPPKYGPMESPIPAGIIHALANQHASDGNILAGVSVDVPTIAGAMGGVNGNMYAATHWLYTPAIALHRTESGAKKPAGFSITYAPLANGTDIRIIATGYDFNYSRNGQPITRTVMQDFRLRKRVNHAIISPSRVLIGKNVLVAGDLGCRYTDVTQNNGDPLVLRSDFKGLDPTLDQKLNAFFSALATSDVDGDNRLRVAHPVEGPAIPSNSHDYDGDGQPDGAFVDVTGDGYVDEFDIFINHYDRNRDGKVALSDALRAGTPNEHLAAEFVGSGNEEIDADLALLLDSVNPDRNRNGVWGYHDSNGNGRWDPGEPFHDYDAASGTYRDQVLGYRDGVIDYRDQYGKVRGRLVLRVSHGDWQSAQGNYNQRLRGPITPTDGSAPRTYQASDGELPNLTADSFVGAENALRAAADGQSFEQQVAQQLGVSVAQLPTYVETKPADPPTPRYFRLDPDLTGDGRPDNWETAYFEKMPFNSPQFSDWYYRPVYENMVFKDVRIPLGTNALFRNCTFVGVTYVRNTADNTHVLFNEYGKMTMDSGSGRPRAEPQRIVYGDDPGETHYPTMLPPTAIPPAQYILMALTMPLDKADIPSNQTGSTQGYENLPAPLVVSGRRVTDTKTISNNIRFHDCLIVGSIVGDKPTNYTQIRNKLQFTGATRFTQKHPTMPDDPSMNPKPENMDDIARSTMMLPNYSVDIGTFNSPPTQNVQLRGAVVAGVLDMRGNAMIDGALLLTFSPVRGLPPLRDVMGNPVGNPANFNASLGYFGPDDGDSESLDPSTLPLINGQRIAGWDTNGDGMADVPGNQAQPPGSTPVPFHGYGRITLRFDPNMALPSGILLPMQVDAIPSSYREGKP